MQINQIQYTGPLLPAAEKRIGVVALATDLTIERDLPKMMPPGAEIFTARVPSDKKLTLDNLRAMKGDIARAAACLLPGRGVHAVIYACTSGAAAIGHAEVQKCLHAAQPNVPAVTPLSALDAACAQLGVQKLSVLTPYTADINRELAKTQTAAGREIINIDGLGFAEDPPIADIPPAEIVRCAKAAARPESDALFVSCTNLRAAEAAEEIEQSIQKTVLTSNQILAWHAARLAGFARPVLGFGKLLAAA